jgi:hypothetical protein
MQETEVKQVHIFANEGDFVQQEQKQKIIQSRKISDKIRKSLGKGEKIKVFLIRVIIAKGFYS